MSDTVVHLRKSIVHGARVQICGSSYTDTQFKACEIYFDGSGAWMLAGCTFDADCSWLMAPGQAANTIQFLRFLSEQTDGVKLLQDLLPAIIITPRSEAANER